jgi:hypothetical protein
MILECIKAIYNTDCVMCLIGDKVKIVEIEDSTYVVMGVEGFCEDVEISLSPKEFAESFKYSK